MQFYCSTCFEDTSCSNVIDILWNSVNITLILAFANEQFCLREILSAHRKLLDWAELLKIKEYTICMHTHTLQLSTSYLSSTHVLLQGCVLLLFHTFVNFLCSKKLHSFHIPNMSKHLGYKMPSLCVEEENCKSWNSKDFQRNGKAFDSFQAKGTKEFTWQTIRDSTNIIETSMAGTTSSAVRSIRTIF